MIACVIQQSSSPSPMSTINYRRKLNRAVTFDSLMPSMTSRKRLLSEQNEFHNSMMKFSNDDMHISKKAKTEMLINDSKYNNQHHVPSFSSFPFFENTIHCPNLPTNKHHKNCTYINNEPCLKSLASSQSLPISKTMILCQQNSVIDNNNENGQEEKSISSIFLTSSQLLAYMTSVINIQNEQLLIIDCGLPLRYNDRRIKDSLLLNINDKLSRKRLISRGLKNFLDEKYLKRLNQSEIIILYDDSMHSSSTSSSCSNSSNHQPKISPILKCIFDEIKRYDSNKTIYILQSSFDEFHQHYPTYCYISSTNTNQNDRLSSSLSPIIDLESYKMSEILPGLYLGNAQDAENKNFLNENNIKSIINISTTIPCHYEHDNIYDYFKLPCNDSCRENILQYFDKTFEYIHKKLLLNENILIHCQGGISRSPSFTIGYLMKYHLKTFNQAYNLVKDKRKIINPNLNFINQLIRYEQIITSIIQ